MITVQAGLFFKEGETMDRVFIQRILHIHQYLRIEIPNGQGIDHHSTWFHIS
jgi:hypothetical protein